jgi:thiazole synthase
MLSIAGRSFRNRLILGTGKYKDFATMRACYEAAGVDMVTVAVRRFDLAARDEDNILHWIPSGVALLPNTAGCHCVEEALRVARLAREALGTEWVKLEVIGDPAGLYPDGEETLSAARTLVREGFVVLPYVNADPVLAQKLCAAGCAAVMPLGSAIGSGQGIQNPQILHRVREVVAAAGLPLVVDAGVGTASDAAQAMELGADGVLLNTAVAEAGEPMKMAQAMDLAVRAGRLAFEAGRMARREWASPSSPARGRVGSA